MATGTLLISIGFKIRGILSIYSFYLMMMPILPISITLSITLVLLRCRNADFLDDKDEGFLLKEMESFLALTHLQT